MATPRRYRISAQGRLSGRWQHWFDDMEVEIRSEAGAEVTTLTGPVADQAALLGLLQHLYTLGLPLLSVQSEEGAKIDSGQGA
jgi:hypothetical protein